MGRRDNTCAGVREAFEGGLCDRRTLGRVGADPDFVETDQRIRARSAENVGEIGHGCGERGQALLDVLMVADVGEYAIDEIDPGARVCRDVQACSHHQGGERDGFEGHGFSARVGPRKNQDREISAEPEIIGDALVWRNQRMPDAVQFEDALSADFGFDTFDLPRELSARDGEIEMCDPLEIRSESRGLSGHGCRQLSKDTKDFAFDS